MAKTSSLLVLCILVWSVSCATIQVGTGTPTSCDETALDNAVSQANAAAGSIIQFNCGSSTHTISLTSGKTLHVSTTVDGQGKIVLSGEGSTRILSVADVTGDYATGVAVTLSNIILENGNGTQGGCVSVAREGSLTLNSVTMRFCSSVDDGGALYAGISSVVSMSQCNFYNNSAAGTGGAVYVAWRSVSFTSTGCTFLGNIAHGTTGGGAIYLHETSAVISTALFRENTAVFGGAIHNLLSNLDVSDSIFSAGHATVDATDSRGAGIYIDGALATDGVNSGTIRITRCSFEDNNSVAKGGAIYVCLYTGTAGGGNHTDVGYIQDSRFCGNTVTVGTSGAAIQYDCSGSLYLTNGTFGGNTCPANPDSTIETVDATGGTNFVNADNCTIPGYDGVPSPGTVCPFLYNPPSGTSTTGAGTGTGTASTTGSVSTSGTASSGSVTGSGNNVAPAKSSSGIVSQAWFIPVVAGGGGLILLIIIIVIIVALKKRSDNSRYSTSYTNNSTTTQEQDGSVPVIPLSDIQKTRMNTAWTDY